MMLRDKLSKNWPSYLPIVVKSLNERHIPTLGGIQPITINSMEQDPIIRAAQKEHGINPYIEPTYQEQNQNQKQYEESKNNFQVGQYVYLDFKIDTFSKSYDTQISKSNFI